MAFDLTFTGTIFTSASLIPSASQGTAVTIAQGGPSGSRIYGIGVTTNSTTAGIHVLNYSSSAGVNRISAVAVTANAGWTNGTANFDYFGNAVAASIFQKQKDANGVPYFNLAPGTTLSMFVSGTFISAGSTSYVYAFGEFY
jgi:hypothetical protein